MNRLCCQTCNEVLGNTMSLPCGHGLCVRCIQDHWAHGKRSNSPCNCPKCGYMFPPSPKLTNDTTLEDVARDADRCEGGNEKRKRQRSGAPTQPLTSTDTGRSSCGRHSSSLDVYCCTDELVICAVCASAEHNGHTLGSVRGERRRKQEELKNIQMKSRQILEKQEKKLRHLQSALTEIEEEARNTEDDCESVLVHIIDSLQRRFLSVKELIRAQEEAAAAQVKISIQTLRVRMEEMRETSAKMERLAQTDNDVHFLQKWPSLRHRLKKDHHHSLRGVSEDPLLPFQFTKSAVHELERQLQEFCDKKFDSISQTADSGERQESGGETGEDDMQQRCDASPLQCHGVNNTVAVKPTTRAEFLQYACVLSLDSATAHQDLAISAGEKEVRLSPLKRKSPAGRYPERFLHRRQVLCREGLQAESCYYEIEVEGEKSEIALAYKGIDRKSRTNLSAFGGSANSWSLDRSLNYSVSHRGDSIQLTTPPECHRIGIFLQFKEGALSFYEVSDRMKFLYKVEAEFTEPLYPGFWLGDKCCIRICDLR